MKRTAIVRQSENPEFVQHLAYGGPDPTTIAGVTELIQQAGLNPYHYFTDEIAARVRDAIADGKASVDDGGDNIGAISAEEFFEWVYEADKGEGQPYGPNLYDNNPGVGLPDVWTP